MASTIQTFDFSVNLLKSIIWQYGTNQPNLQGILQAKQNWYNENQEQFWQDWLTDVFDLRTANDFGCVVWAIILGLPLTLFTTPVAKTTTPWGFDAFNKSNFNNYNFAASASAIVSFTTAEKRMILQLRYRQLVSRGTIPEINKILADVIQPIYGKSYMLDCYNMSQKLICLFSVPSTLLLILEEFDLLPRPATVNTVIIDTTIPVFGFGPTNQNFGNGGFSPYG